MLQKEKTEKEENVMLQHNMQKMGPPAFLLGHAQQPGRVRK